jgi:hypothetical protein
MSRTPLDDMFAHIREIFWEYPELLEEYEVTFPVTPVKFWAQKKNRNYLKLSEEVASKLTEMLRGGPSVGGPVCDILSITCTPRSVHFDH